MTDWGDDVKAMARSGNTTGTVTVGVGLHARWRKTNCPVRAVTRYMGPKMGRDILTVHSVVSLQGITH